MPFAGHPNVGTAFALATAGLLGPIDGTVTVTFEELAGLVPVVIDRSETGGLRCELRAPEPLSRGRTVSAATRGRRPLSLDAAEIVTRTHQPVVASVGLPFLMVELRDRAALERARARR